MLLASTILIMPGDSDPANGGYRAYNNFGDGLLYNLNIAPKSAEVNRTWNNGSTTTSTNALSRLNGPDNTDLGSVLGSTATSAQLYAKSISVTNFTAPYLPAIDELQAISSKLRASVTTANLFKSGGSEELNAAFSSTSSETSVSTFSALTISSGAETVGRSKGQSDSVRPIRRFLASAPFPIGTAMEGGYLAAYFTDLSSGAPLTYMLIVADIATEVTRAYQTSASSLGGANLSRTNGFTPSEAAVTNSAAMFYCQQLTSGTKTDWYLPAVDELLAIKRMEASLPSGQQLSATLNTWTSTEVTSTTAMVVGPAGGTSSPTKTTSTYAVRPVRRVLLP